MHRYTAQLLLLTGMLAVFCGRNSSDTRSEAMTVPGETVALTVGESAPMFTLPGTPDGEEFVLGDVLKERPVLLAFFPKTFTGG